MEEAFWGQRCRDWVGEVTSETQRRARVPARVRAPAAVQRGCGKMTDAEDKQVEAVFRGLTQVKGYREGE